MISVKMGRGALNQPECDSSKICGLTGRCAPVRCRWTDRLELIGDEDRLVGFAGRCRCGRNLPTHPVAPSLTTMSRCLLSAWKGYVTTSWISVLALDDSDKHINQACPILFSTDATARTTLSSRSTPNNLIVPPPASCDTAVRYSVTGNLAPHDRNHLTSQLNLDDNAAVSKFLLSGTP
jgi:hypothetical protein